MTLVWREKHVQKTRERKEDDGRKIYIKAFICWYLREQDKEWMSCHHTRIWCSLRSVPLEEGGDFFFDLLGCLTLTIRKLSRRWEATCGDSSEDYLPRNSLKSILPFLSKSIAEVNSST